MCLCRYAAGSACIYIYICIDVLFVFSIVTVFVFHFFGGDALGSKSPTIWGLY